MTFVTHSGGMTWQSMAPILTLVNPPQVDLAGPVQEWKDLAPVDDGSNQYLGDLCISLRYVPSSGKLTGRHGKE